MPPKFTPRAPQVGRYWPGKALKDQEESSSDEEEEEEDEESQAGEPRETKEDKNIANAAASRLVTTLRTTNLSEQGPYLEEEEESSESDSDEDEANQPEKRTSKVRQAHRRAIGDFVAVDQLDLEEEDEQVHHSY